MHSVLFHKRVRHSKQQSVRTTIVLVLVMVAAFCFAHKDSINGNGDDLRSVRELVMVRIQCVRA